MDLAARLRACMRRWHLQSEDRLSGGFRSEVFECTTASGEEVVVKLTVAPEDPARGAQGVQRLDAARAAAVELCATAIWTVLETCSAWREDQSDLEACLSSYKFEHLIRG
jgi:hypothetical protein